MLFADEPPPDDTTTETPPTAPKAGGVNAVVKDPSFIVWSVVLAGVLLLAAVLFMFFDRWRKRPTGETARDTSMSLSSFRQMYENGELTEAEYQRIRDRMASKLKEKMGVPASPPAVPPPPEADTPPPETPPTPPPE